MYQKELDDLFVQSVNLCLQKRITKILCGELDLDVAVKLLTNDIIKLYEGYRKFSLENYEIRVDSINRLQAIKAIQKYGVGSFDFEEDDYTPEQAERFVIKLLSELPPAI